MSAGANDNATANAAPDVAGDVLGQGAGDGVGDLDRGLDPGDQDAHGGDLSGGALTGDGLPGEGGAGDRSQPRTGAEQPVDPEDLLQAKGEDVTPITLDRARRDLEERGPDAVRDVVPDRETDPS